MALAKMTFDELNQMVGYKVSEPIDEYFTPMILSEEQKEQRREAAYEMHDVILALLVYAFYADQYGISLPEEARTDAVDGYLDVLTALGIQIDQNLRIKANERIASTLDVLYRHIDDPWYYSDDRAIAIAENESNGIWDYTEYREAVRNKNFKTWHTIMDGHERDSHAEVNGVTLPINVPFELRGGYMQYPHDDSLGVSDDELIGCRCSISFS